MSSLDTKISLIIPVFNAEKYLEDCLNSIINQTYKNLEIILINDGSEDKSKDIINYYCTIDNRIIHINQKNLGVSIARNNGIKIATGEYIGFIDSDDYIDNNYIENLYNAITKTNSDISCCSILKIRKNRNNINKKYRIKYDAINLASSLEDKIKLCNIPECCYIWAKLYKKDLIKDNYFKKNKYFEDILWLPETLKKAKKIASVPNTKYYYRYNKNSIVNTARKDKKKEKDSYNSKKYIINFFRENNLTLSEKNLILTRKRIQLFDKTIIKIKEKNFINTWLLFSFIPILRYEDFDNHYKFKLFNLKLNIKHKCNFEYEKVKEFGLNNKEKNPNIIVSLTSYKPRINYVSKTINTLLNQTLKPNKIILWLSEEDFKNKEKDLPKELIDLKKFGLEINWCENILSYKKLVPSIRNYPNDIIVTADDDIYYQNTWLNSLYIKYLENPKNIYTRRSTDVRMKNGEIISKSNKNNKECLIASYNNQPFTGSGCLIPPHSLNRDILNIEKIKKLIPTHDDIYVWVMALLNNTKIQTVCGYNEEMLTIDGTQKDGLYQINKDNSKGMSHKKAREKIINEYPEIKKLIEN